MSKVYIAGAVLLTQVLLVCCGLPPCRFAHQYTADELLTNPASQLQFIEDVMYYESQFHQDQIGYSAATGLTYDGRPLNFTTGEVTEGLHEFSASSKESIHVNMLALALNGSYYAQLFISPEDPSQYEAKAIEILTNKMTSYEEFNQRYPAFGGFFPWFYNYNSSEGGMTPTSGFSSSTPSLDNGQLAWAIYTVANVLALKGYTDLAKRYFVQLDLMATNAIPVFYAGDGKARTVAGIKSIPQNRDVDITGPCVASNYYTIGDGFLDDPRTNDIFHGFVQFMAKPNRERIVLFIVPHRYGSTSEHYSKVLISNHLKAQSLFKKDGAHEQWKFMILPYMDVDTPYRVFMNGERARTINSASTMNPGLHASTNDVSDTLVIPDYVSDSGITSIAFQTAPRTDIITPYGAFPVILANMSVGLVWYHNMISGPKMQGPHGSTEAILINGTMISPLLTWDTKITTVNAILGGTTKLTSSFMAKDGVLERFQYVAQREYSRVFTNLSGEDIPFALPANQIPTNVLSDFTMCTRIKF